jgi:hypothetical protein
LAYLLKSSLGVWVVACILISHQCLAATSLNDLSDESLRVELANDGLTTLLDRAFEVDNIPPDRQLPERAVIALRQMSDPTLTPQRRAARLQDIVAGISTALPEINDPQILLSAAALLVKDGVVQDVNALEYFGEDGASATKARLHPIVKTAIDMYDRAVDILNRRQLALQNNIQSVGDAAAIQWQNVYKDYQTALYTRWMLSYSYLLSLDTADKDREKIATDAIQTLAQWDNPDSGVEAMVRLQIGKLYMAENQPMRAQKTLRTIFFTDPLDSTPISPPPDRFTIFNAYYFYAVCNVLTGNVDLAEEHAKSADTDRLEHLPGVTGDDYAMDMLNYRIALLKNDSDAAVKILQDLSAKAPGLRPVIAGHLLDRMPPHPEVAKLSPLMLSALIERGWAMASQPSPDVSVLNDALTASQRYLQIAASGDPDITPAGTLEAYKARGVLLKALGEKAEAASAFLDYAEHYKDDLDTQAADGLNAAIEMVAELYQADVNNPHQTDVAALEDRLLPLAVESFHRYDLAYEYARHLQRAGHPAHAAEVFDLVPKDDPNALNAMFFEMVAMKQCLDADPHDVENAVSKSDLPAFAAQIQKSADQFRRVAEKEAADHPERAGQLKSMVARTTLLAADVASRQARDPRRTLDLLNGFENSITGLADERQLLAEALNLRVAAYIAAGDTNQAAQTLVQFLNTAGGNEGLQTVYNLLTRLNQQLDRAQANGETKLARQLADDRAALTPFLVQWARSNPNPDISKFTYRYEVFDAATQDQAAELEPDPAKRTKELQAALAKYRQLQSPQNVALYQSSLSSDAGDDVRNYPDPQVTLGIGNVAFALSDWKTAHDSIGQLLADSKLGDGTITVKNAAGQEDQADNDQFWEANYKFIYATMELAKDPASKVEPGTARTILDRLTALWQDHVGGAKWHAEFMELAGEMK